MIWWIGDAEDNGHTDELRHAFPAATWQDDRGGHGRARSLCSTSGLVIKPDIARAERRLGIMSHSQGNVAKLYPYRCPDCERRVDPTQLV